MKTPIPRRCVSLWPCSLRGPRYHFLPKPLIFRRGLRASAGALLLRTQKLGDVGEGITECMLNMWFVEEGARVEEWDKLCEMQSDKAAVEISANYSGVIKKLYAQADDMVKTGAPLADIDDGRPEEEAPTANVAEEPTSAHDKPEGSAVASETQAEEGQLQASEPVEANWTEEPSKQGRPLATPAVRGLLKEQNIDIARVRGTGKNGRILKEDVQAHVGNPSAASPSALAPRPITPVDSKQIETVQALTPIQSQMYRIMTASLKIPHFLFADEVNVTRLSSLRRRLNQHRELSDPHLTLLPFVLKALSMSLRQYPILNARLDTNTDPSRPQLVYRNYHNIGIAMDTPAGLLVPVVKNAAALSIVEIAHEIRRFSELGQSRKLSNADLGGGTISVSNIGNIGGTVVAPLLVEGQVAILGMGRSRARPVFGEKGGIEKAEIANFSWSADHRVIDGATMARMAGMVKKLVEEPESLMVQMR